MRNLLALLAAALLLFVGLGWYLGWYRIGTTPGTEGHRQINIDLNTKKITEDVNKGVSKSKETLREFLDKDGKKVEAQPTGLSVSVGGDGAVVDWKR
jgi:hypothetical protein